MRGEGGAGLNQPAASTSRPSGCGVECGGRVATKNRVSKRTGTTSGVIQRDHATSSDASAPSAIPVSSSSSRAAQTSAAARPGSTAPPGKTQTPGMNDCLSAPPDHQHLEPAPGVLVAAPQQHDRRRRAGSRRRVGHVNQTITCRGVHETATKQLWICTSCGFIYDPDDGDPDGGIPPGTASTRSPTLGSAPSAAPAKPTSSPRSSARLMNPRRAPARVPAPDPVAIAGERPDAVGEEVVAAGPIERLEGGCLAASVAGARASQLGTGATPVRRILTAISAPQPARSAGAAELVAGAAGADRLGDDPRRGAAGPASGSPAAASGRPCRRAGARSRPGDAPRARPGGRVAAPGRARRGRSRPSARARAPRRPRAARRPRRAARRAGGSSAAGGRSVRSLSNTSRLASAAAQASGLPVKVWP